MAPKAKFGNRITMSDPPNSSVSSLVRAPKTTLRGGCLSYSEVIAQSVSVIAPSTVPAAVLGLIFARAGNATWLSFLLGMLGLLLVSLNINQFARRSASPGSLYSYVVQGLGPTAGVLGGWALLFGYVLTGMSTLCGFALVANSLAKAWFGIEVPTLLLFAANALLCFYIAFRDIQLSAKTMLWLEAAALALVVLLVGMSWQHKGFALDTSQVKLEGATASGTLGAVVLVVFAFSGFESSTSLGDEARKPLVTIPRSVVQSVLFAGLFFIATAYFVVLGFQGTGESLAASETPLSYLAQSMGWGGLGALLNIGILFSFFSCTLAAINSSARILFAMAQHGLLAGALGEAHARNQTPHVAAAITAFITFGVPAGLYLAGESAFDSQGYFGTLCSFGFITVYILISLAAPVYLRSIGKLTARAVACSVGAVAFMLLPLVGTVGIPGSELFPTSSGAGAVLIVVFALYMTGALAWLFLERARRPKMIGQMQHAIEQIQFRFADVGERALTPITSERSSRPSIR